jgi:hypothetical protein
MPTAIQTKRIEPKVTFVEKGKYMYARGIFNVARGVVFVITVRVDMDLIERNLRDGYGDTVEGLFGSIFKGIKKAVKSVAKWKGFKKILDIGGKILKNPILQSVVPEARFAAGGTEVAKSLLTAAAAAKVKHPKAKRMLAIAAVQAKQINLNDRDVAKGASRIYELIVNPK